MDEKIIHLYRELRRKEKIEIHLKHLEELIAKKKKSIVLLARIVDKELKDVELLSSMSLRKIFRTVLKDKEAQLERERQEYLLAYLKHEATEKQLSAAEFEKEVLTEQLEKMGDPSSELKRLLFKKKRELIKNGSEVAAQLLELKKAQAYQRTRIEEIDEALEQGENTLTAIAKIRKDLENIEVWKYEMYGQGRYSSYRKKKFIEKGKGDIVKIDSQITRFSTELKDVSTHLDTDFSYLITTFGYFLDEFYDNLISDWVVQEQLKNTIHTLAGVKDKVIRIRSMLKHEIKKAENEIDTLEKTKDELVLNQLKNK